MTPMSAARRDDAEERCGRPPTHSPPCSPSRWAWPASGSHGGWSLTWCSATASASTPRPASQACSVSTDGALLMAERGRLFGSLPAGGRMVAVFAAAERVESLTDEFPSLSVAAYNGANTVLSGPAEDLEQAVARLTADGVRCDWLETSHAFHSALLDPILDEFEAVRGTVHVRYTAADSDRQPHGRRPRQERETRRGLLATSRAPTGGVRQERAHDGRAELQAVARDRPPTGAHRRRPVGLAGPGHRTASDHVAAPKHRRPQTDHRSRRRRVRPGSPARIRRLRAAARHESSTCPPIRSSAVSTRSATIAPRRVTTVGASSLLLRARRRFAFSKTAGSPNSPPCSTPTATNRP